MPIVLKHLENLRIPDAIHELLILVLGIVRDEHVRAVSKWSSDAWMVRIKGDGNIRSWPLGAVQERAVHFAHLRINVTWVIYTPFVLFALGLVCTYRHTCRCRCRCK